MHHLEIVLKILKQNQLFAKFSKCIFRVQHIGYLGHTLSGARITMDNEKLEAVINWIKPITVKQLRAFLGLTGFYRHFVKGYAQIAAPLTDFYRFQWTAFADKDFQELKLALTRCFVLAIPNFAEPFVLEINASGSVVGVVLSQNRHPIVYFS